MAELRRPRRLPRSSRIWSAYTEGVTPDPIPNSVVKPLRADGSNPARDCESRTALWFFFLQPAAHSELPVFYWHSCRL